MADRTQFINYIQRNLALQELRTGFELSVESTAQYMRTELAQALRKGPYQVNLLIGGYDLQEQRAKLYWMDYLGTLQQVNKGAQRYAGYFVNSVLDNHFKADMSMDQGIAACKDCIKELQANVSAEDVVRPDDPSWLDPCNPNSGNLIRSHRIPQYYNGVTGRGLSGWWVDPGYEHKHDHG